MFPCSSGGQKFEIKVFTAWCSLQRLAGRILPCFFQHMVVAGHARHSLACSFISLFSASILTRHSSCVCLCLVFPLCVCVSPFSLPIRTPVIGLGPTLIRYNLIFILIASVKTLFPNKVTSRVLGGRESGGDAIQLSTGGGGGAASMFQ